MSKRNAPVTIEITRTTMIDGRGVKPGSRVVVPSNVAANLIDRERAKLPGSGVDSAPADTSNAREQLEALSAADLRKVASDLGVEVPDGRMTADVRAQLIDDVIDASIADD